AFRISPAQVLLVDPDNRLLLKRRDTGALDNVENTELETRFHPAAKEAGDVTNDTIEIEASSESFPFSWLSSANPAEVIGFSAVQLDDVKPGYSGHGVVVLTVVPRKDAYATIYGNQVKIGVILALAFILTSVLGWFFGRWFIRPLL